MSAEAPEDRIVLGDVIIEVGPPLPRPDAALITEYSGQLIVAHYLDENGELARRPTPWRYDEYPTLPQKPPQADQAAVSAYEQAIQGHIAAVDGYITAVRARAPEPIPPVIGHVDISAANPYYFSVHGLDGITSILPYARDDQEVYRYLIHAAREVE